MELFTNSVICGAGATVGVSAVLLFLLLAKATYRCVRKSPPAVDRDLLSQASLVALRERNKLTEEQNEMMRDEFVPSLQRLAYAAEIASRSS